VVLASQVPLVVGAWSSVVKGVASSVVKGVASSGWPLSP
jgi:hypothetical protein